MKKQIRREMRNMPITMRQNTSEDTQTKKTMYTNDNHRFSIENMIPKKLSIVMNCLM